MKIQLISDLHLEFEPTYRPTNSGSDVLILSGDILVADYLERSKDSPYRSKADNFLQFLEHCSNCWKHVVYVMGNHEHYMGRYDKTYNIIKKHIESYDNIHLLEKQVVTIDGVKFVGATLWTNQNNGCPITESTLRGGLNDYRVIQLNDSGTYRKLNPKDTLREFMVSLNFIDEQTENEEEVVVCTHHAPSLQSITERFKNDHYLNGGYVSDLNEFVYNRPNIKLWTHGHVHSSHDYMIGETRIACNPRGYNGENPEFDDQKLFEI